MACHYLWSFNEKSSNVNGILVNLLNYRETLIQNLAFAFHYNQVFGLSGSTLLFLLNRAKVLASNGKDKELIDKREIKHRTHYSLSSTFEELV